jgi:hypothetical protein
LHSIAVDQGITLGKYILPVGVVRVINSDYGSDDNEEFSFVFKSESVLHESFF